MILDSSNESHDNTQDLIPEMRILEISKPKILDSNFIAELERKLEKNEVPNLQTNSLPKLISQNSLLLSPVNPVKSIVIPAISPPPQSAKSLSKSLISPKKYNVASPVTSQLPVKVQNTWQTKTVNLESQVTETMSIRAAASYGDVKQFNMENGAVGVDTTTVFNKMW